MRKLKLRDRELRIMRQATSAATSRYGDGGRKKTRYPPKPITLPKLKFLATKAQP